MLGGCLQFTAFTTFWAISTKIIDLGGMNTWTVLILLSLCSIVQFLGSSSVTGQVFATAVRNFPAQKGRVVGLIKGWVGLCGGMYTQIFIGFVPVDLDDQQDPLWLYFCLVAAICCISATFVPSQFIEVHDAPAVTGSGAFEANVQRRVHFGYGILLCMGVTVVGSALLEHVVSRAVLTGFAVLIIIIWASPLILAWEGLDVEEVGGGNKGGVVLDVPLIGEEVGGTKLVSVSLTISEMVRTLDFWLFLWPCLVLIGGGIGLTTNIAQMFGSIYSNGNVVAMTFFSATQSLSRVGAGGLCDVLRRRGLSGAIVVLGGLVFMLVGYVCFVMNTETYLFVGVVFCGVGFGSAWPVMVVVVAELFGEAHLGGNYMVYDGVASAVGALLFGKFIPEEIYDAHTEEGETDCYGKECFQLTYWIVVGLVLSAMVSIAILIKRIH
ncbi:hypothetical protein TL16_g02281 [Triparma laevis f. inornata]|uniref:Major facilitator superfamily (MFS) profile domain-containing protein n=1 Tax=Triparma laevis f. inornata TaxID=1714386 RepID=A0A9W6ZPY0_9STRA|nr:hypothetical protein TL16_g02281 [Triparma laevis f. inornata]